MSLRVRHPRSTSRITRALVVEPQRLARRTSPRLREGPRPGMHRDLSIGRLMAQRAGLQRIRVESGSAACATAQVTDFLGGFGEVDELNCMSTSSPPQDPPRVHSASLATSAPSAYGRPEVQAAPRRPTTAVGSMRPARPGSPVPRRERLRKGRDAAQTLRAHVPNAATVNVRCAPAGHRTAACRAVVHAVPAAARLLSCPCRTGTATDLRCRRHHQALGARPPRSRSPRNAGVAARWPAAQGRTGCASATRSAPSRKRARWTLESPQETRPPRSAPPAPGRPTSTPCRARQCPPASATAPPAASSPAMLRRCAACSASRRCLNLARLAQRLAVLQRPCRASSATSVGSPQRLRPARGASPSR